MNPLTEQSTFTAPSGVSTGVVIGSYADYADAQRLVDHLSDSKFPVQHVRIIGRGLHSVEQVVGRMTKARAAISGLISGALLGLLFGWLMGIFVKDVEWWKPLLVGAAFGALWGALMGFLGHSLTRGQRDFSSLRGLGADKYDVEVDPEQADAARQVAASLPQKLTGLAR